MANWAPSRQARHGAAEVGARRGLRAAHAAENRLRQTRRQQRRRCGSLQGLWARSQSTHCWSTWYRGAARCCAPPPKRLAAGTITLQPRCIRSLSSSSTPRREGGGARGPSWRRRLVRGLLTTIHGPGDVAAPYCCGAAGSAGVGGAPAGADPAAAGSEHAAVDAAAGAAGASQHSRSPASRHTEHW